MLCFILLLVATGSCLVLADEPAEASCGLPLRRLPERIRAKHYDLHIEPSIKELEFNGQVRMDLEIDGQKEPTNGVAPNQILFHANKGILLDVKNIKFTLVSRASGQKEVAVTNVCRDEEYELVVVTLAEELPKQKVEGQLFVRFYGELRNDMFGFYKSSYYNDQNEKHYLATTQFESTEARKAFPCFDEPLFKATFDVTILHEPHVIALSNTEVIEEKQLEDGRKLVKFARTPPMSTYLLAFVIGEFDYIERVILGGRLKVRVYTTPGESHKGQFALDTTCRAIQLMEEYFGIEFPLNKMDLIGIPDFENGAMENWGLITFREVMLLTDELDTTPMNMVKVAYVIVHELAHQWFGNLVTMHWWNDLWLKEGFATWFSYHMLEQVHPQFDTKNIFSLDIHLVALAGDANHATHAIRPQKTVETNKEIAKLFDSITYKKSASVLRFLHNDYLGPELFRESLRHYMAKHKYGNTVTDDLCSSMEEVSKLPVKPILDSWVAQEGYPVLHVDFDGQKNTISIEQDRYTNDFPPMEQQRWIVPVSMVVVAPGKQELISVTVPDNQAVTTIDLPEWFWPGKSGHWLKLNHDFYGLYRSNYSLRLLNLFEVPIKQRSMSPSDRLNVLNDAYAMWDSDYITGPTLIKALSWYANEDHGVVLDGLVSTIKELQSATKVSGKGLGMVIKLERFIGRLLEGNLEHRLFHDPQVVVDPIDENGLAEVLKLLVSLNHQRALEVALGMLEAAGRDINKIKVALREPVYLAVARAHGTEQQFDQMLELLKATKSRQERNRLIPTLGLTPYAERKKHLNNFLYDHAEDLKVDFKWQSLTRKMKKSDKDWESRQDYAKRREEEEKKPKVMLFLDSKNKDIEESIDNYLAKTSLRKAYWAF